MLTRRRFVQTAGVGAAAAWIGARGRENDVWSMIEPSLQAQAAKAEPLARRIRELEAPLYDLHNEIATISRALGGRTVVE